MSKSRFLINAETKPILGQGAVKILHLIQNKIRKDLSNLTKYFRAEKIKFILMPTGTSYDQGICACSSMTMCTVTTAISKMPKRKQKAL